MKERGPDLDAIEVAAAKYTQRSSPYETEHRGKPYREIDKVDIECIEDATFLLCICLNNFSEYLAAPDASRDKYCAPWRDTFLENYLLPLEKRKKLQVRPSTLKV